MALQENKETTIQGTHSFVERSRQKVSFLV